MSKTFRFPPEQKAILEEVLRTYLPRREATERRRKIEAAVHWENTKRTDGIRRVEYALDPARFPGLMVYGAGIPDPASVDREDLRKLHRSITKALGNAKPATRDFVRGAVERAVVRDTRRICPSCALALNIRLEALPEAINDLLDAPLRGYVFEPDENPEVGERARDYAARTSNHLSAAAGGVSVEVGGRKGKLVYRKVREQAKRGPKGNRLRDRFLKKAIAPLLPPMMAREHIASVFLLCACAARYELPTSTSDTGKLADGGLKHAIRKAAGTREVPPIPSELASVT